MPFAKYIIVSSSFRLLLYHIAINKQMAQIKFLDSRELHRIARAEVFACRNIFLIQISVNVHFKRTYCRHFRRVNFFMLQYCNYLFYITVNNKDRYEEQFTSSFFFLLNNLRLFILFLDHLVLVHFANYFIDKFLIASGSVSTE